MARATVRELAEFNAEPVPGVSRTRDVDFVGDGIRAHRLDVLAPTDAHSPTRAHSRGERDRGAQGPAAERGGELPRGAQGVAREPTAPEASGLPVYVYFHGGGWTSGDKDPLTTYCAEQARSGMVVVNVNYRMAPRFQMRHIMHDASAALTWVRRSIAEYGGDPDRIVLGGDSAGGQIAALAASVERSDELASHYGLQPVLAPGAVRGLVQHCSAVDFTVFQGRSVSPLRGFVPMLLPKRGRGQSIRHGARWLSPIEWLAAGFPSVFVSTSERDFFYRANLNFIERLRAHAIPTDTLIYNRRTPNVRHTWQQNPALPQSREVYARLQQFVQSVAAAPRLTSPLAPA
ncbi:hypothetical protein GCM10027416_26270 [Okibacterium endophyticum]